MAFWRFGFAQESGIDGLLKNWENNGHSAQASASTGSGGPSASTSSSSSSINVIANNDVNDEQPNPTLEQLLEEDDLLQECKAGHSKLLEYLSSPYAVKRMLAYVSGEAFDALPLPGATADQPAELSEEEKETTRKRLKYPYLCTEILNMDPWQVTETIFRDTDSYLVPLWDAILDKPPETLVAISVQVGHWSKINNQWLTNTRVPQMIQFLKTVDNLFPRLLVHLPYISPIYDILNKLVTTDDAHPQLGIIAWLHSSQLLPQVLDLLDPVKAPIEAHTPAGDFLRGIVAAASAASASKQQQQQQAQAKFGENDPAGQAGAGNSAAWTNWPNNALIRELAHERTIKRLLGYMLDPQIIDRADPSAHNGAKTDAPDSVLSAPSPSEENEPSPSSIVTPTASQYESLPSPQYAASTESLTSSLLNSLTLIIDIIRKNNSDFTELQILQYLERANGGFDPDNADAEDDDGFGGEGEGEEGFGEMGVMDQGPSLVDLGPLLVETTKRLPDLHKLLLNPRSNVVPLPTTLQGEVQQEPLTFERFRICELYAELLHCSNMAILNRAPPPSASSTTAKSASHDALLPPVYDSATGRITGTRKQAFERLSRALNAQPDISPDPTMNSQHGKQNGFSTGTQEDDDEGMVEDISLTEEDDNRPVTAQSDVTSSYTSGASDGDDGKENSEDVFDALNTATEGISLDDDAASLHFTLSNPPSVENSPMPPTTSKFGSAATTSTPPPKSSAANGKAAGPAKNEKPSSPAKKKDEPPLLPGSALKRAFVDLEVVPAVLDLFFRFPWNNFLHNVVYDLVQQIFNGKLDPGPNRDLCIAVFTQGKGLVNRVLDAIEENTRIISQPRGVRLGHMGHLTLVSEEIVKLLYNNPKDILPYIPGDNFDKSRWESYVEGTLRETRERDLQPLGGGVSIAMHGSASTGSAGGSGIGIIEMDDEFPAGHGGSNAGEQQSRSLFSAQNQQEVDDDNNGDTSPDKAHFARYLASQISSDFSGGSGGQPNNTGKNPLNSSTSSSDSSSSGSSSSDDNLPPSSSTADQHFRNSPSSATSRRQPSSSGLDTAAASWFSGGNEGDSAFDDYDDDDEDTGSASPSSGAKGISGSAPVSQTRKIHDSTAGGTRQERFGFDSLDAHQYGTGDSDDDDDDDDGGIVPEEDDDGFGPFSDNYAAAPSPQAGTSDRTGYSFDDDFGGSSSSSSGTAVLKEKQKLTPADWNSSFRSTYDTTQPSFGEFGDFNAGDSGDFNEDDDDFGDFAGGEDENGDYDFSQTEEATPSDAVTVPGPTPAEAEGAGQHARRTSLSRKLSAGEEVVGPGVHEGAHISKDGKHVEAEVEVDGEMVTVQVPRDELALHPEMATGQGGK